MTTYLQHHGIKGQRWGIRRYQNEDGSLTPAGEKRYGNSDKESSNSRNLFVRHKQNIIDKYVNMGYSEAAANTMASQRIKTEATIAVIGGIALAYAGSKVAKRIGEDYCDKVIKAGKIIQNISGSDKTPFGETPFYAAINKHDKEAYGMMYPNEKRAMLGAAYNGIYNNQLRVIKDVKMPSVNKARKILYSKMESDPQFKLDVMQAMAKTQYSNGVANDILKYKSNPKKFYDKFNQALATPAFQNSGINTKFYSELEKNGYNALLDINDTRYSGYKGIAKSPTIFFGKDVVEKIQSRKISDTDIDKNVIKYGKKQLGKLGLKTLAMTGSEIAIGKKMSDNAKVKKYLKEHPNSEMSREEILKTVTHQKNTTNNS